MVATEKKTTRMFETRQPPAQGTENSKTKTDNWVDRTPNLQTLMHKTCANVAKGNTPIHTHNTNTRTRAHTITHIYPRTHTRTHNHAQPRTTTHKHEQPRTTTHNHAHPRPTTHNHTRTQTHAARLPQTRRTMNSTGTAPQPQHESFKQKTRAKTVGGKCSPHQVLAASRRRTPCWQGPDSPALPPLDRLFGQACLPRPLPVGPN